MQAVLRCELCNKPFNKESTLKRHGYYCRSRKAGPAYRVRSCVSCATSKARCDNKHPQCTRCATKGAECIYPSKTSKVAGFTPSPGNVMTGRQKSLPSLVPGSPNADNHLSASSNCDVAVGDEFRTSDSALENLDQDFLDWIDFDTDLADHLSAQASDKITQQAPSDLPFLIPDPVSLPSQVVHAQEAVSPRNLSMFQQPSNNIRSLVRRPYQNNASKRVVDLMLHTLQSYPLMMMRHNMPPPFIHPHLMVSDAEDSRMEPLNNCMSLLVMVSNSLRPSQKLFWKNVRMECERFHAEHLNFDKWELLAAMNAVLIYIFVRLGEGETEHNNLDSLLLTTVIVIGKRLEQDDIKLQMLYIQRSCNFDVSWNYWIFQESIRRICAVAQIANLLVYFEPASMCDLGANLILAPLPTKKQLWEASDEVEWKLAREKESESQIDFGLAANGDLVTLDEYQLYGIYGVPLSASFNSRKTSGNNVTWEDWSSEMDGLGGLIALAASLTV